MPQELSTKMMEPLKNDKVRPYETKTVYATGFGGHHKEGDELIVHPLLAEKLIAQKKATEKAPKTKEDKK